MSKLLVCFCALNSFVTACMIRRCSLNCRFTNDSVGYGWCRKRMNMVDFSIADFNMRPFTHPDSELRSVKNQSTFSHWNRIVEILSDLGILKFYNMMLFYETIINRKHNCKTSSNNHLVCNNVLFHPF